MELHAQLPGFERAQVQGIMDEALNTVKNLCWFQGVETRGDINKGKVHHWQVTVKT